MQNRKTDTNRQTSVIGRGTEKLYYEDAYMREFDAVVLQCEELSGPCTDHSAAAVTDHGADHGADPAPVRYSIILDRTAFFPEEGGQNPDRGCLSAGRERCTDTGESEAARTAQVLDVQIHDGIISHVTDMPFEPGTAVHGVLDFQHRFSNMQQHSAEHLCSGLVFSRLGLTNVGFHLSDTEVTMDYSGPVTPDEAAALELEVNRLIWQNIESRQEFPSQEELRSYSYRSKSEIDGQVRLVVFPGVDICACCAPHVARTGEIGLFRILSVQSHRGGVRVRMLAGERALRHLIRESSILTESSRTLSTSPGQVPGRIEKLRADLSEVRHALSEANLSLLMKEADAIPASQKNVCLFSDGLEEPVLRSAVNQLMEKHEGVCGIFNGNDLSGYRYVIGSSTADVMAMQQRLKETCQARGGGKPPMIQGQVHADRNVIRELFRV